MQFFPLRLHPLLILDFQEQLELGIGTIVSNQAEVERVADTLNRINLDLSKLDKRVNSNEESVQSIDAFRRQIMASITELQASVRVLQSTP